ncbi:MAG: hypothetical protein ABR591_03160 [Candidatus Velthaea sp.]
MRPRFEFTLYTLAAGQAAHGIDPTLALMGSQGWELRAMAQAADGALTLALQRPLDEDVPLPDAPTLAATLTEPLVAPRKADLEN